MTRYPIDNHSSVTQTNLEASGGELLARISDGVVHVTLNRPAKLNSLSYGMLGGLTDWLRAWAADDSVRAVVVRGAGEKAFCAGGDIRWLHDSYKAGNSEYERYFEIEYTLDHLIHRYPKPYVAVMDGIVMGGGMGISQGASLRVVSDRTRMAMPETGIGLIPDVGGSFFLSRLPGAIGPYLGLTGSTLNAADSLYSGLADLYLTPASLDHLAAAVTSAARLPGAREAINAAMTALSASPEGCQLERLRPAIDAHFSLPSVQEIVQSLAAEDRTPYRDWASATLERLGKCSPLLLCVTLEQLRRGRALNLSDCFRMELGLVNACLGQGDTLEGIRALIIDKDNQPRWNPARIADVTSERVQSFFHERWMPAGHPLVAL